MATPTGLTENQQLSFLIGEVVRLDASVTATAHTVFREIHRALGLVQPVSYGFDEMHQRAHELLEDSGFDPDVVEAGRLSLGAAFGAHLECIRLVQSLWKEHDHLSDAWVRRVDSQNGRQLPAPDAATITHFKACRTALDRAEHQLSAYVFVIPATEFDQDAVALLERSTLAIARGEFVIDDSGRAEPTVQPAEVPAQNI